MVFSFRAGLASHKGWHTKQDAAVLRAKEQITLSDDDEDHHGDSDSGTQSTPDETSRKKSKKRRRSKKPSGATKTSSSDDKPKKKRRRNEPDPIFLTPKPMAPKPVAPKLVTPKLVTPKLVTPKLVTPKLVTPKPVTPKPVTPKPVTPTEEARETPSATRAPDARDASARKKRRRRTSQQAADHVESGHRPAKKPMRLKRTRRPSPPPAPVLPLAERPGRDSGVGLAAGHVAVSIESLQQTRRLLNWLLRINNDMLHGGSGLDQSTLEPDNGAADAGLTTSEPTAQPDAVPLAQPLDDTIPPPAAAAAARADPLTPPPSGQIQSVHPADSKEVRLLSDTQEARVDRLLAKAIRAGERVFDAYIIPRSFYQPHPMSSVPPPNEPPPNEPPRWVVDELKRILAYVARREGYIIAYTSVTYPPRHTIVLRYRSDEPDSTIPTPTPNPPRPPPHPPSDVAEPITPKVTFATPPEQEAAPVRSDSNSNETADSGTPKSILRNRPVEPAPKAIADAVDTEEQPALEEDEGEEVGEESLSTPASCSSESESESEDDDDDDDDGGGEAEPPIPIIRVADEQVCFCNATAEALTETCFKCLRKSVCLICAQKQYKRGRSRECLCVKCCG
jgi:hypothetical protein